MSLLVDTHSTQAPKRIRDLVEQREEKRGLLIAFEGPEGSGRSTQRGLFKDWLTSEKYKLAERKFGASALVKPLLKARKKLHALSPREHSLLLAADYRNRLEDSILPALWEGETVVADRYLFTSLARDISRGMDLHWLMNIYQPILWPDIVFYFSVSADKLADRRTSKKKAPKFYDAGQDVTEMEDARASYREFINRVVGQYEALSLIFQFVTVDTDKSIYEQSRVLRDRFKQMERRRWAEWNLDPVAEWLVGRRRDSEEETGESQA